MILALSISALTAWLVGARPGGRPARPDTRWSVSTWPESPLVRMVICIGGCGTVVATLAGIGWTPIGIGTGVVVAWWLGRAEPASVVRRRRRLEADLPLAADLLAACASVGEPLVTALPIVADAVGGPLADAFRVIDARTRLGADPESEWRRLFADASLAPLARTIVRSLSSGAPMAAGLQRLADDARRVLRTRAQVQARSVGVRCAGPLAVCFLPAFVLVGIVPTIVAAFGRVVLAH